MAVTQPVVARRSGGTAGTVRANADAARSVAAGSTKDCSFCGRQGVPILPLRYAVIPNYLEAGRGNVSPQALLGGKESALGTVPQMQRHRYTVRTLREGYLYAYLNRPGQWQVYSVTPEGNLRLLADPDDIDEKAGKEMSAQCKRSGDNIPASFIHIANPARTPVVWLAFSTARWSAAVRAKYEADPAKRMQRFDVAKLDSAPDGEKDALELNGEAAARLTALTEEYPASGELLSARQEYVSKKVGDLASDRFTWESAHDMHAREGQAVALQRYAQHYRDQHGQEKKVAAVVLHDAMGMLQEIDATRQHSLKAMQNYMARVARPLAVSQSIIGLEKFIEQSTLEARVADEQARNVPDTVTETIQTGDPGFGPRMYQTYTTTRAERAAGDARRIWSDLAKKYDEQARASFQSTYDTVMTAFADDVEMCDVDWAAWAKQDGWLACLDDYDPSDLAECARFTIDVAQCLAGGAAGSASEEVWETWIGEGATIEANPVYQSMLLKQKSLCDYLVSQDGALNKGDKLYDAARTLLESKEFEQALSGTVKLAVANVQTATAGAMARIVKRVGRGQQAVSNATTAASGTLAQAEVILLRSQQVALLIFERVHAVLVEVEMTLGEYQKWISEASSFTVADAHRTVQRAVDSAGRQVRSVLQSGGLGQLDEAVRNVVIKVKLWTYHRAKDVNEALDWVNTQLTQSVADIRSAQAVVNGSAVAVLGSTQTAQQQMRSARVLLALMDQEAARSAAALTRNITVSQLHMQNFARQALARTTRIASVGGPIVLVAGTVVFQGWALRDALKEYKGALSARGVKGELGLLSPTIGLMGASLELLGAGLSAAKIAGTLGGKLTRGGGVIAAGSSLVDSVVSFIAASDSLEDGDKRAAGLHAVAGVAYLAGGTVGIYAVMAGGAGAAALFGPVGIALLLIAAGVALTFWALSAESTPIEIWLDRCYFGHGKRTEGKWTDLQAADELAALNAVVFGVSVTLKFSDSWLWLKERFTGYDRIELEVRLPGFDPRAGGYHWVLKVRHKRRGDLQPLFGEHPRRTQTYMSASPRARLLSRDRPENWFRESTATEAYESGVYVIRQSIDVNTEYFQSARLVLDYWPDRTMDDARASIDVEEED